MGQMGFFDLSSRYAGLDKSGDPLVLLNDMVPFEDYRDELKAIWRTPPEQRKSNAGRPPWDEVLIFKTMVLQQLYNLSDDQIEYQIRDRLSFMRFLGLGIEDSVPDAKTIWAYRERLAGAGKMKELFDKFDAFLREKGYLAMGGQIVDASIVPAPRQHNKRDENEKIKAGETPEEWEEKPHKKRQKDVDARWTKKHGKSYYGYKNHINVDRRHKFIRAYDVTDAAVHDSQALAGLIDASNTSSDLWADSAYRSQKIESELEERGLHSHIHHKGRRGKPLGERQQKANRRCSKVRVRVEHVFAFQERSMGGKLIRSIGLKRARFRIGMMNLVYNMKRFVQFECGLAAPG
ncbi:IS5 family transposase [Profundibacter sp.]|uniref:IS5 family transposase n=1 Tax=Profundibacter sp. TaxID=3101071 RepID=UPI003D150621